MLIAMTVGYTGGIVLTYVCGRAIVVRLGGRMTFGSIIGALGMAGGAAALYPGLYLATVVGGLGGAYGEVASSSLGLGRAGVPIGLALGLAIVTALVATCGVLVGATLGKLINALTKPATQQRIGD
jgi:hypothetical protein